jgi:hypothetical protein
MTKPYYMTLHLFSDFKMDTETGRPGGNIIYDIVEPSQNASLTIADHLLVSREAQAIIGGVVGFWGGVFGMGSVYLLVVFLRRLRKQAQNSQKHGHVSNVEQKVSKGYSAMFGAARPTSTRYL